MTSFDPLSFRNALGCFATGVTIVTAIDGAGRALGITVNSFSSVSLDPPLILWSLAKSSGSLEGFTGCKAFAIHVLGSHQQELALRFATRGEDRFRGLARHEGETGAPLIEDCAALFECEVADRIDGGDHVIFLGRVVRFAPGDHDPLIFHRGQFRNMGG